MTNNDILRRLRYAFDLSDSQMIATFATAQVTVSRAEVSDWLKKDEDPAYQRCSDERLAAFLNGFIIQRRGKRDGDEERPAERKLSRNNVLRKLRIALDLKSEDMLEILNLAQVEISKHELSALFRKPTHKHYRECQDQFMRGFLKGLQLKHRESETENPWDSETTS
jgi:uncharacterized protein YehS (DUF1456 family)